jgi:CRISPR-associated protein (TIGR02584 family)
MSGETKMKTSDDRARTQQHILLCVAGLTPQIITETLYALTQRRGERVDEVRVITTIGGRDRIMKVLLDQSAGKFYEFCRDYGIDSTTIRFDETTIALLRTPDGRTLADIRTVEENEYAGDQICEIVRELTKDTNTHIHASAAGGRKTMSIYLTAAMQLFGRAQDRLSHVLVSEEFETHPDFFYKPPAPRLLKTRDGREVSTDAAEIYLADIPFIRLRGVGPDGLHGAGARSYGNMVARAQADLDLLESEHKLQIDLKHNRVAVGTREVQLTPRELFFYAMFAGFRRDGRNTDGTVCLDNLKRDDFDRTFRLMTAARDEEVGIEECVTFDEFEFLQEMVEQITSGRERDGDDFKEKFHVINARIHGKFKKERLPEELTIRLREERGLSCYSLSVAPQRIQFI